MVDLDNNRTLLGTYLSVVGNDIRVFRIKEWNEVVRLTKHTDDVNDWLAYKRSAIL